MKYFTYDEDHLAFKDITPLVKADQRGTLLIGALIGIILCVLILGANYLIKGNNNLDKPEVVLVCEYPEPHDMGFSQDTLADFMKQINMRYPHVVMAQSILETGKWSSTIFKENHNLFGMKEAKQRPKLAKGTKRKHAYYHNWKESVLDYALWQCRYAPLGSEKDYLEYIAQVYAEDDSYITKINKIIEDEHLKAYFQH